MRVAIITSHPIQYQTPLFRKLTQRFGVDATVFFCWDFGIQKTRDEQFGIDVHWDIPLLNGFVSYFPRNFSPRPSSLFWGQINPSIIGSLIHGNYDAVILFGWNSVTNILAYITAQVFCIPLILHGESTTLHEASLPLLKKALKTVLLRAFFSRFAAFLVIGNENERFYRLYGVDEKRFFWCPYTVDTDRFLNAASILTEQKHELRKKYNIPDDCIVILTVGKLIPKKRPLDLLSAFQRLNDQHAFLLYVGEGELRISIERACAQNSMSSVRITGFVNQSLLPEYYCLADIFALCSDTGETWGLVVNEAMCCGLPIIISRSAGCQKDLVQDGVNGYTYACGDSNDLSKKLLLLVTDTKMRLSQGARSQERIREFTHDRDCKAIIDAVRFITTH